MGGWEGERGGGGEGEGGRLVMPRCRLILEEGFGEVGGDRLVYKRFSLSFEELFLDDAWVRLNKWCKIGWRNEVWERKRGSRIEVIGR